MQITTTVRSTTGYRAQIPVHYARAMGIKAGTKLVWGMKKDGTLSVQKLSKWLERRDGYVKI